MEHCPDLFGEQPRLRVGIRLLTEIDVGAFLGPVEIPHLAASGRPPRHFRRHQHPQREAILPNLPPILPAVLLQFLSLCLRHPQMGQKGLTWQAVCKVERVAKVERFSDQSE